MNNICSICKYNISNPDFTIGCMICCEEKSWSCTSCYEIMHQSKQGRENYDKMLDIAERDHYKEQHVAVDLC